MPKFVLYGYWRSSCSWRVRSALMIKGLDFEYRPVGLTGEKENTAEEFRKVSGFSQVPALVIQEDGSELALIQSLAIIQYLDEAFPDTTALLPKDPLARVKVRIVSDCIAAGIQPLQNIAVLEIMDEINGSGLQFAHATIASRFADLELILKQYSGKYCVGDEVTMADLCLVPQVYNAVRYGVDVSLFPTIERINEQVMSVEAIARGHPDRQADAPQK